MRNRTATPRLPLPLGSTLLLLLVGCSASQLHHTADLFDCSAFCYEGRAKIRRMVANGQFDDARQVVREFQEMGVFKPGDAQRLRQGIDRQELQIRVKLGLDHLAAAHYAAAAENLRSARRVAQDEVSRRQVIDALCIAEAHIALDERARRSCEQAKALGAETGGILSRIYEHLAHMYAAEIDKALASGDAVQARSSWLRYENLPTKDSARVRSWDKKITALERETARRKAAAEEARRQALEEKYYTDLKTALAHLSRRWRAVRSWTKDDFILWLASQTTVLGAPIFSSVEIPRRNRLELWLTNSQMLSPNLSHFADFADAFSVWCNCDGVTSVGIDARHLPGGDRIIMYYLRLNLATGRSQIGVNP